MGSSESNWPKSPVKGPMTPSFGNRFCPASVPVRLCGPRSDGKAHSCFPAFCIATIFLFTFLLLFFVPFNIAEPLVCSCDLDGIQNSSALSHKYPLLSEERQPSSFVLSCCERSDPWILIPIFFPSGGDAAALWVPGPQLLPQLHGVAWHAEVLISFVSSGSLSLAL